tara:strand:- start:52093 stop:52776 length:684 start_codon:yes stop_codon:yes gene_type:complete
MYKKIIMAVVISFLCASSTFVQAKTVPQGDTDFNNCVDTVSAQILQSLSFTDMQRKNVQKVEVLLKLHEEIGRADPWQSEFTQYIVALRGALDNYLTVKCSAGAGHVGDADAAFLYLKNVYTQTVEYLDSLSSIVDAEISAITACAGGVFQDFNAYSMRNMEKVKAFERHISAEEIAVYKSKYNALYGTAFLFCDASYHGSDAGRAHVKSLSDDLMEYVDYLIAKYS